MVQKTNININKARLKVERRAKEQSFKIEFKEEEMQGERDRDARMSKKVGQRCQVLLTVMYFTDLSRITLLSAMVENKFYLKEKIILFTTEPNCIYRKSYM